MNNVRYIMNIILCVCSVLFCYSIFRIIKMKDLLLCIDDDNYKIIYIKDVLSDEDCDYIDYIYEGLVSDEYLRSINYVYERSASDQHIRVLNTSSHTDPTTRKKIIIEPSMPFADKILKICSVITGYSTNDMSIIYAKYETGDFLKYHYDCISRGYKFFDKTHCDRIYTLIFYLNNLTDTDTNTYKDTNTDTLDKSQGKTGKSIYKTCKGYKKTCKGYKNTYKGYKNTYKGYKKNKQINEMEEEAGGETHFPEIDTYIKPNKGDGILFKSLTEDGIQLKKSLHGGMKVNKGTKKILAVFVNIKD